jgi:hypothetical protein
MQLPLTLIALLTSPAAQLSVYAAEVPVLDAAHAATAPATAESPPTKKPKPRPKPQPSPKPRPDPCPACGMG